MQGASGKLQAFGFCEYGDPDASLRAIRLLHELELGDKKLVVSMRGENEMWRLCVCLWFLTLFIGGVGGGGGADSSAVGFKGGAPPCKLYKNAVYTNFYFGVGY